MLIVISRGCKKEVENKQEEIGCCYTEEKNKTQNTAETIKMSPEQ